MLNRAGIDLQPQVDTIHLAAVETLRPTPDHAVIEAGQRALHQVIDHASKSSACLPIVTNAKLIRSTFELILNQQTNDPMRAGHNVIAMVADLGRTISAIDQGRDPTAFVDHTNSLFNAIPGAGDGNLIEIDLSDASQLAQLLQGTDGPTPAEPSTAVPDVNAVRDKLAEFAEFAEMLLEYSERPEITDGLINSLLELQSLASSAQIEHVGRVVACALRVIESHRAAGESLPLDAVEFIVACRRIIPMILENIDDPQRVSHAVDALVDQSSFVLKELRKGTQSLVELWPEPDANEYQRIATGMLESSVVEKAPGGTALHDGVDASAAVDPGTAVERQPSTSSHLTTQTLIDPENMIRVPVERIDTLIQLVGELAVRSGGYTQRSRKLLSVAQDINSIGDRMRYLIRGWQEGRYQSEQARQHLSEITADLGLAAADLENARNDHLAASERQALVREQLETTITKLRNMPLSFLTDPLYKEVTDTATRHGRKVKFRVDSSGAVVDVLYADAIRVALRHLLTNAIEHGIEPPDVREQKGKRPEGRIRIRAGRDGSQTVIQVLDDGAGIDDARIVKAAQAAGYPIPPRGLTRDRILQYIFLPGFSTKPYAGGNDAGMGLDEVSEAVSSASGSVTIHSEIGRGTVFTIRLPVASMSMSGVVVAISDDRFAIPAAEYEILSKEDISEISETNGIYHTALRGEKIPTADLGALLSMRSAHHVQNIDDGTFLRVTSDDEPWVLRVDRIIGQQSIELGPLGRDQAHIIGAVGSTNLPSGETAIILDIAQVLDAGGRRGRRFSRQTASLTKVPFALVSDDSISVRRHLAGLMEGEGWRVVEARDPFEARELLQSVVPDLLVVDLDLPAYGGFQIIQTARSLNNMPVIGLTARDDDEIRRRAESSGIDGYLSKPLDYDEFLAFLRQVVHGPSLE